MITIKELKKSFKDKIVINNLSLNVFDNEVYGILGPNGAGKTTLVRQLMGFVKPDAGEILINNIRPWNNAKTLMQDVGYIAGEIALYENLTGNDLINVIKKFKKNLDVDFLEQLIVHFDMKDEIHKKIKKMSKGQKQKIAIIIAAMSKPKVLILDEPTSGLDPLMQEKFNVLIYKMKKEGSTIIICSHIFEEVANLCNTIGFLRNGKIIKEIIVTEENKNNIKSEFLKLYSVGGFN